MRSNNIIRCVMIRILQPHPEPSFIVNNRYISYDRDKTRVLQHTLETAEKL